MPDRRTLEAGLGLLAAIGLALAVITLSFCSTAHADIQIDSSGRTLGAPLLRSYLPNGTAHLQGLVLCDKTTPERCVTVNADGSITAQVTISSVTVTSSALPTGAAIASKQPAFAPAGTAAADVLTVQGIAGMTPLATTVSGTVTSSVSSSALPTGASTAAKQPALGSAGTASVDVITIQGIASMTPVQTTISGSLPSGTNVIGHIICDSGCSSTTSPSYGATFPSTGTPVGFTDGTNMVPARVRTATPGATDQGIVVRPLMPSDGTNTMPAGDSSARSIHVTVDNGSATVTENGNLTLGTAAVAETVALGYGQVVTTPSTMTLGTNGTGMRATFAAAGQRIVQMHSPRGDWRVGKATATGTTDTTLVAAAGSGVRFCMTHWAASNTSATDTTFRFRESSTDLTEALSLPNKGGNQSPPGLPLCGTANTAFQFKLDTGVTTGAVTVWGYLTKE